MRKIALIPARLKSSRLPEKMIADLCGLPVIVRTYQAVKSTGLFDRVIVVTDSEKISEILKQHNCEYMSSSSTHKTGSDRIAEAAKKIDCDIILNVQGDEPFIKKEPLEKLLSVFEQEGAETIDLATIATQLTEKSDIENPNNVKLITDKNDFAMYFSRFPIPFLRDNDFKPEYLKHIGVYAFRKESLIWFSSAEQMQNEKAEQIECLRYLEYGKRIKIVKAIYDAGVSIDTEEDLLKARELFLKKF